MIKETTRPQEIKRGGPIILNLVVNTNDGRNDLFNNGATDADLLTDGATGGDNKGADDKGADNKGADNKGTDNNAILDAATLEGAEGADNKGADADNKGADNKGADNKDADLDDGKKAIATKFGGTSFNKEGDLLGADGKVVKTKVEIDEALANEPKFDEKGNEVNAEGQIVRTVEQVEADNLAADNETYFTEIQQAFGIKPLNVDGTEKKYAATQEGINAYYADVVAVSKQIGQKELLDTFPDVAEYYKFRAMGGDPTDYFKDEINYTDVKVEALAEDQKYNLLVQLYQETGIDKGQAEKLAKYSKDAKEIDNDLGKQLELAKSRQTTAKTQRDENLKVQRETQVRDLQEFWGGIKKQVVETGKIGDFVIPITEREEFFKYISAAVDKGGNSQALLDASKRPNELKLLIDYMYGFKKGQIKDIIANLTGTVKAEGLRRIKQASTNTGGGNNKPAVAIIDDKNPQLDRESLFNVDTTRK